MWDDFYEPSEFEGMIEDLKEELRGSVKKEYTDRIEHLEAELTRLKDIRDNYDEKVRELNVAKHNAEIAAANAESKAKKAALRELLEPMRVDAWAIDCKYEYIRDKCNLCDVEGYIHYFTPSGRKAKEICKCREQKRVYSRVEAEVCKLSGRSHGHDAIIYFEYHKQNAYNWEDEFERVSEIYEDGTPFGDVGYPLRIVFLNKDKAQEFCDWLNNKEEKA